jgi:hypothetical protein
MGMKENRWYFEINKCDLCNLNYKFLFSLFRFKLVKLKKGIEKEKNEI